MKKTTEEYFCDLCKIEKPGERLYPMLDDQVNQEVVIAYGGHGDAPRTARVQITFQAAYAFSHEESSLCSECKVKILERAIKKLKA